MKPQIIKIKEDYKQKFYKLYNVFPNDVLVWLDTITDSIGMPIAIITSRKKICTAPLACIELE